MELQDRLSRCESLLEGLRTKEREALISPSLLNPHDTLHTPPTSVDARTYGRFVQDHSGVVFVDNVLWGHIHDEMEAMRAIVDEFEDKQSYLAGTGDFLLSNDGPVPYPGDLHPEPAHVFRLWQIFIDRVNPLLKLIHIPTLQPYVVERTDPILGITSPSTEALLFAIYALAITSLTQDEALLFFGYDRSLAITKFTTGLESIIHKAKLLTNFHLVTLQVLLQENSGLHASWIWCGPVLRMAQKMGLHRDGEALGLTVFECEMRRRVWWALISQDCKCAILLGHELSQKQSDWSTRLPSNINDADIFTSTTRICAKGGPTEMVFCIVLYTIVNELLTPPIVDFRLPNITNADFSMLEDTGLGILVDRLEPILDQVYLMVCDASASPLHQFTIQMRSFLSPMIYHGPRDQRLQQRPCASVSQKAGFCDIVFQAALSCIWPQMEAYQAAEGKGFLWFVRSYFQKDLFAYLVGQLCRQHENSSLDKAWSVVRFVYHYHPELYDISQATNFALATQVVDAWEKCPVSSSIDSSRQALDFIGQLRIILQDV